MCTIVQVPMDQKRFELHLEALQELRHSKVANHECVKELDDQLARFKQSGMEFRR